MQHRPSHRGFSLVELMISLVVGLIVSGAALALVASIIKSNSDTVRSTRLTQELRATAEIIGRDLRRARSVSDPIGNISLSPLITACNTVDVSTAGCVRYGYDCTSATAGRFFSVGLVGSNPGKVYLKGPLNSLPACPTSGDTLISSDAVEITAMTFTQVGTTDAYTILLTGKLVNKPSTSNKATLTSITRSISQEARVRSAQVQ